jgi:hypothetical protein
MKKTYTKLTVLTGFPMALLSCLLLFGTTTATAQLGGACQNATLWPSSAETVSGTDLVTINGCNYEEEYSIISGIQAGRSYEFTADGPTTYITIRQGAVDGVVLAAGFSPLTGVAATGDDIYVHWSADAACATATDCITTTVQDVTPPCENSIPWPATATTVLAEGSVTTINGCNYAEEYSQVTGLIAGNYYEVTASGSTFITVREGAVDGPVVTTGTSLVSFTASTTADLYIHWTVDANCTTAGSGCLTTTIEDQGVPPCENTSSFGSATASAVAGTSVSISGFAYAASEYSTITGILNGFEYELAHEAGSYVTVRSGAVDGVVLASGFSPLTFAGGNDATVYVHWTVDASCTQDATGSWDTDILSIGYPICENSSQWPSGSVTVGAAGAGAVDISTSQYSSGEYSVLTGITASAEYVLTHGNGVFITVRSGAVDGPVVGSGVSPLTIATTSTDDLYVHWNEDQGCNIDESGIFTTTVENLGVACVVEAGTLTTLESQVCFPGALVAVADDAPVVPVGYVAVYVVTDGAGNVVGGPLTTPEYTPTAEGTFVMHTMVLDPNDQATILAEAGNGAQAVADLFEENGGALCGSLDLNGVTFTSVICPDNDDVCNATALSMGANGPYSNLYASTEVGESVPGAGTGGSTCQSQDGWCSFELDLDNTIWFTFVAPASGNVIVSTDNSDHDTQLAVYSAVSCQDLVSGTAVLEGANDDNPDATVSNTSEVVLCGLTAGDTYFVQVDGYSGNSGDVMVTLTETTLDAAFTYVATGLSVVFTDASTTSSTITDWAWDFDDAGATSTDEDPTHTFTADGPYTVCLTVTDENGCTSEYCEGIQVSGPVGIVETLESNLSMYPNPSNGQFVVEVNGVDADAQITVMDVAGRQVYTEGVTMNGNFRKELNLNVASGTYLVQISTVEGKVTRKIQIN